MTTKHHARVIDYGIMAAITPGISKTSAPRSQMTWAQAQQAVVIKGAEPSLYLTGLEDQLADATFQYKAPCDMEVVAVINKFPHRQMGRANFRNPLITVIYLDHSELLESGATVYGCMHIESFQNQSVRAHTTFSYDFEKTDAADRLRVGATFSKGTVFAKPPTDHDGVYGTGINLNTAYMGRHATIEDGYLLSEDIIPALTTLASQQYTAAWGKKTYPLKLYGDRIMPDIGDKVRPDGLLFAARSYDPLFDGILMTEKNMRRPHTPHDKCIYAHAGATVRDITTYSVLEDVGGASKTPAGLGDQPSEYTKHIRAYYERILSTYNEIKSHRRSDGVRITKEFHALIVEAYGYLPNTSKREITRQPAGPNRSRVDSTFRSTPLDEWHVNITVTRDFKSEIGAKLTGMAGNKGVVCKIVPQKMLGYDENGVPIHLAVWAKGAIGRVNAGQYEEHYLNAHGRKIQDQIVEHLDKREHTEACNLFSTFLGCFSHTMLSIWNDLSPTEQVNELEELRDYEMLKVSPVDDPARHTGDGNIFEALRNTFGRVPKTRVTFENDDGRMVTTKRPVMVAPMYFWQLEKIDHKPFASYGLRRQHHGLPASTSRSNKYRMPVKESGARVTGEAETRANAAAWGGLNAQLMMDMSANIETTAYLHRAHFTAPDVTQIENAIPRDKVPYGSRATSFISHILMCRGIAIVQRKRSLVSEDE